MVAEVVWTVQFWIICLFLVEIIWLNCAWIGFNSVSKTHSLNCLYRVLLFYRLCKQLNIILVLHWSWEDQVLLVSSCFIPLGNCWKHTKTNASLLCKWKLGCLSFQTDVSCTVLPLLFLHCFYWNLGTGLMVLKEQDWWLGTEHRHAELES